VLVLNGGLRSGPPGSTYLGPTGTAYRSQGIRSRTRARIGRIYDAIRVSRLWSEYCRRTAEYAGAVYNGLTNEFTPTQILADFLTMQSIVGKALAMRWLRVYCDAANNMGEQLAELWGAENGPWTSDCVQPRACWPPRPLG